MFVGMLVGSGEDEIVDVGSMGVFVASSLVEQAFNSKANAVETANKFLILVFIIAILCHLYQGFDANSACLKNFHKLSSSMKIYG